MKKQVCSFSGGRTFAARCRKLIKTIDIDEAAKPCECTF